MISRTASIRRLVMVRLNPGEDILQMLRQAVEENHIQQGLILSGLGSLNRYRVHVVKTTAMPPGDVFFEGEGPFDILALTGAILAGRVHAHITFSNTEKALGGHLEEGCRVLTFAVATLAETDAIDFTDWDRVGPL
jgi:predicted DNA-binding protein with PD1-like motif